MYKLAFVLACSATLALAQEKTLSCDNHSRWNNDGGSFCEIREVTIPSGGSMDIDGGMNGGVSVKGWNRNEVLVRSQVQTSGNADADAQRLASQIRVEASAGQVRASGPSVSGNHQGWGVSFEIFVPERTDVSIKTHNGGVHISDVHGRIQFDAVNGGVHLARLGGDVEGHTTNGGLHVELAGSRWDGTKCDVSTTNGGIKLMVPASYSAHLETGTVNGGMNIGFPVTVQGKLNKELSVDVGSGGNLVRAMTTNGGVNVERI
jgi:DUF4097 and DUF4098 domain-containing protein YvlB